MPACASGEEVYTLAICLLETAGDKHPLPNAQIFGTDIDPLMIAQARAGVYSTAATTNLTPQRLERYFQPTDTGYHIQKQVREMCSFAVQNLTRDPPFSKVDLICCRNLFIYLRPEVQEQILNLFHFALNPGGRLMLGSAESLGRQSRQ